MQPETSTPLHDYGVNMFSLALRLAVVLIEEAVRLFPNALGADLRRQVRAARIKRLILNSFSLLIYVIGANKRALFHLLMFVVLRRNSNETT